MLTIYAPEDIDKFQKSINQIRYNINKNHYVI